MVGDTILNCCVVLSAMMCTSHVGVFPFASLAIDELLPILIDTAESRLFKVAPSELTARAAGCTETAPKRAKAQVESQPGHPRNPESWTTLMK